MDKDGSDGIKGMSQMGIWGRDGPRWTYGVGMVPGGHWLLFYIG